MGSAGDPYRPSWDPDGVPTEPHGLPVGPLQTLNGTRMEQVVVGVLVVEGRSSSSNKHSNSNSSNGSSSGSMSTSKVLDSDILKL
eukprot:1715718-Pyramimonas_sp.AAC.1